MSQSLRHKRLVYCLDTPFSEVPWPEIAPDDQDTILELLCNLLRPIGQHRKRHVQPSKGKRAAKRRSRDTLGKDIGLNPALTKPEEPDLCRHIDVGFCSLMRELESVSSNERGQTSEAKSKQPYAMVFVARGNHSAAFHSHFPKLIGAASKNLGRHRGIRLIGFSKPCSDQLSSSLGLARVSCLAVRRGAPGTEALSAFVEDHLAPVNVAWLGDMESEQYRPTKIASAETTVGARRDKTSRSK